MRIIIHGNQILEPVRMASKSRRDYRRCPSGPPLPKPGPHYRKQIGQDQRRLVHHGWTSSGSGIYTSREWIGFLRAKSIRPIHRTPSRSSSKHAVGHGQANRRSKPGRSATSGERYNRLDSEQLQIRNDQSNPARTSMNLSLFAQIEILVLLPGFFLDPQPPASR